MPTLVLKELAFAATQRKIVVFRIDRKDLPHLTVSWNNPSGEIDVHLTPVAPTGPDDHISLLKVKETDVDEFCKSLVSEIIELLKSGPAVTTDLEREAELVSKTPLLFTLAEERVS